MPRKAQGFVSLDAPIAVKITQNKAIQNPQALSSEVEQSI